MNFVFVIKANNGKAILSSEGYSSKSGVLNSMETVKKSSQSKINFEQETASNGKYFLNLKGCKWPHYWHRQMNDSTDCMINGLAAVLKNSQNAGILDKTL